MIRDALLGLVCLWRGHRFAWRVERLRAGWAANVLACERCGGVRDFRSFQTENAVEEAAA